MSGARGKCLEVALRNQFEHMTGNLTAVLVSLNVALLIRNHLIFVITEGFFAIFFPAQQYLEQSLLSVMRLHS